MSADMRGPRVRTPHLRPPHHLLLHTHHLLLHLLLLLLVLISLTGTVWCDEEDDAAVEDVPPEDVPDESDAADSEVSDSEPGDTEETAAPEPPQPTDEPIAVDVEDTLGSGFNSTGIDESESTGTVDPRLDPTPAPGDETLSLIIIPLLVALVVVIIGAIVCGIFINRRWKSKKRNQELRKEDLYLDGPSTEKVPMPMFEEDVPSVLELEMEEFNQWMKMDGETAEDSNHA